MAPLKILQFCAVDATADVLLRPLIESLKTEGHQVDIACAYGDRTDQLREEGWVIHTLPIDRKFHPKRNLQTIQELVTLLRREKYDAIHVHTPVAAALGRVAARIARTPHILYTAHGFYFHERMSRVAYELVFWLEKSLAALATDWLLLQSEEDYSLAKTRQFKRDDRLLHLGNGIDLNRFKPIAKTHNPEQLKFLFVGRLVREKGILDLLQAFTQLSKTHPGATLTIAGELMVNERDQETGKLVEAYLVDNPNVHYAGFVKDTPTLFSDHDVFLLPSYREGLPRSILEAMASGLPVIATNIRGCREEVIDHETGYLVPVASPDALAEAMESFILHPERLETYGRRGREVVEERFDESIVLTRQLDLFAQISAREAG
ncbi:glycosyltransferase family 4 protein [Exiguobacterium alkaliphilum]|uniref:glycosyltransferase family 4 protein n=1 Tax=Exiguobacterium alkaliphilum TaxID=1428684 RepID=UPI001BAA8D5C|nr:glycosyltransferase family 4 protein [Exiguobacterium alkaliphilum]QUE87013.1 glycosyltransferase family 4 protein [Exiguobacterium alkaliphilum]